MKKLFLMLIVAFGISFTAEAQKPFVSPFASLSNKHMSYGLEAGLAYKRTWYSVSYTYTPNGCGNYLGANLYNKIVGIKKATFWLYNSLTMDVDTKYFVYAPGISFVFDVTTSLSPQFTFSIPIVNQTKPCYTLGLMYNF